MIANSELRRIEQNLFPNVVLVRARAQSCAAFARAYTGTLMLLVRVDESTSDLKVGLEESTAEVPPLEPTRDRIGFSTSVDPEELRASGSVPPPPIDHLELRKRLMGAPYFAVPIRKRETGTKPFAGKISVGRARNNDIVLRHPTVSKFHAWFEVEEGRITVADARSKNRTWLAREPLPPGEPAPVAPGAELYFGRVLTLIVSADDLWRASIGDD